MIKILDSQLNELTTVPAITSGDRTEEINGENLLSFSFKIDGVTDVFVDETAVIGYGSDYFDIASYEKVENGGQPPEVQVECEHVSYRLNNPEYNKEYFTELGTPAYIFGKILDGTEFTFGTIEFTETLTYSAQEAKSRRQLLFEFTYLLGGELVFDGFEISIVAQRGSTVAKDLTSGGNVTVLSKKVDKRKRDDLGNPTVYYVCALYNPIALELGDVVTLEASKLDIDVELRVVKLSINPYDKTQAIFEISNTLPSLEDAIYRIETSTIAKGKTYYGARISPEHGFESIRSDKQARTVMNADIFAMQAGDGTGNWTNKLYFDPTSGKYIFDGTLSAEMIEALEAQFDVTVSNVTITNVLAAETGYIAQLTVDSVETSTKVQNYLAEDISDVNYIKIFEQYIQFITASTDGSDDVQARDRNGNLLYWKDEDEKAVVLDETDWPVMIYVYVEQIKAEFAFEFDGANYVPKITLGLGDGVTSNSAKAEIYKGQTGLEINYYRSNTGELRQIKLADDGIFITPYDLEQLDFYNNGFTAKYSGETILWNFETDGSGRITELITEDNDTIPVNWHGGSI